MRRFLALGLVFALLASAGFVGAQDSGTEERIPEPYDPEEFSDALKDLRRAEIVAIGSFPITFVLANLGYGVYRYASNGFDAEYAPLGPNRQPRDRSESINIVVAAASLSVTVAILDYLIGRRREKREALRGNS
ncbi:hypothetical protein GF395_04565 [Candidatus Uhrbacteria bacterium]|nr:hypothetical protein [Candidatus Uhrbacteria bacterium]